MNQELLTRLDALAAKLGVASEMLWAAFVRQAYINLLEWAVFDIIVAVVAALGLRALRRADADEGVVWASLILGVIGLVALIGTLDAAGAAINPAYYAASKILEALGGAR